jgi:colicin import membrane protein
MTTTAPPPEAEALATAPKAIVISQFDVLLGDIKEATAAAVDVTFDYNTKEGNKAARSYIFAIRKLKARIESARTDAKAYALAYGRKVDSQAAELKDQVDALIKPHQDAIDAITKAEADRVARHREVIGVIQNAARIPFGAGSEAIATTLRDAKAADIDGLEEFKEEAAAALLETIRTLEAAHTKALADEAAAAELAQLREQQRIQQEKDAEDARIKAQQEAIAEAARKAQEEANAAALLAIQEAEQKAAEAEARAEAAEADAAAQLAAAKLAQQAAAAAEKAAQPAFVPGRLEHLPIVSNLRARLLSNLLVAMEEKSRFQVAEGLVDGTLHPAITIDWSKV